MKSAAEQFDEIPVTLLVALAYVTLAFVTDPLEPTGEALAAHGWLTPFLAANGEPWRLLTCAFLHGGILHLVFNLATLLAIGPALERSLGSLRFLLLYVVSALGGSIGVCLLYGIGNPVVGGSGALFGMMGALVAINMRSGRHLLAFLDFEGPRRLFASIAGNLVIGWVLPFVSNTAHIGGLLAGFLVTFLWLDPGRADRRHLRRWRLAFTALFASLLFASIVPATRYDWLWNQGVFVADPIRRERLQRAAAMSCYGLHEATAADVARFHAQFLEPLLRSRDAPGTGR